MISIVTFAQYDPIDVEQTRSNPPPEFAKLFNFLVRMEGPVKPTWVTLKNGKRVIGYNDQSYDQSNPANKNAITENMARARLVMWIETYDKIVTSAVKVPLTRQQTDALIDYLYTTGDVSSFINSQIVRTLNVQKQYNLIPVLLRKSATADTRTRREHEVRIWTNGEY